MNNIWMWWAGQGLRYTVLMGSVLTSIGVVVKLIGVNPDLFYVILIGQAVCAVGNVFLLGVPANLAAVWFGPQQVSSACAIAVSLNQVPYSLPFFFSLISYIHLVDRVGIDSLLFKSKIIDGNQSFVMHCQLRIIKKYSKKSLNQLFKKIFKKFIQKNNSKFLLLLFLVFLFKSKIIDSN